ncbi:hypothetical protein [Paenibacillus amylolyticus]|uniref:hypothetical protein n=1 Tax=Paenibacillus amylolyticus TaxID=1451 RepID=UPI003EB843E5
MNEIKEYKPEKTEKPVKPVKTKENKNKKKTKKKTFVWNIRNKMLVSFLVVLLVPSLAIGLVSLYIAEDTVQEQLNDSALQSVSTANKIVETQVNSKIYDINFFSDSLDSTFIKGENDSTEASD